MLIFSLVCWAAILTLASLYEWRRRRRARERGDWSNYPPYFIILLLAAFLAFMAYRFSPLGALRR